MNTFDKILVIVNIIHLKIKARFTPTQHLSGKSCPRKFIVKIFLFCIPNLNKLEDLVCIVRALMMAQLLLDFLQIISFLRLCGLFEEIH